MTIAESDSPLTEFLRERRQQGLPLNVAAAPADSPTRPARYERPGGLMDELRGLTLETHPWTAESVTPQMVEEFERAYPNYFDGMSSGQKLHSVARYYTNLRDHAVSSPDPQIERVSPEGPSEQAMTIVRLAMGPALYNDLSDEAKRGAAIMADDMIESMQDRTMVFQQARVRQAQARQQLSLIDHLSAPEAGVDRALHEAGAYGIEFYAMLYDAVGLKDTARNARAFKTEVRHHFEQGRTGDVYRRLDAAGIPTAKAAEFLANLAPSALSLVGSGGSSAPVLGYYFIQAAGGFSEEYRANLQRRGMEPEAIDTLVMALGAGVVEVVAERTALNKLGELGRGFYSRLGDAVLRGRVRIAADLLVTAGLSASTEGAEELITQFTTNAMTKYGFYTAPAGDPNVKLTQGLGQAFGLGALGGGILLGPSLLGAQRRPASELHALGVDEDGPRTMAEIQGAIDAIEELTGEPQRRRVYRQGQDSRTTPDPIPDPRPEPNRFETPVDFAVPSSLPTGEAAADLPSLSMAQRALRKIGKSLADAEDRGRPLSLEEVDAVSEALRLSQGAVVRAQAQGRTAEASPLIEQAENIRQRASAQSAYGVEQYDFPDALEAMTIEDRGEMIAELDQLLDTNQMPGTEGRQLTNEERNKAAALRAHLQRTQGYAVEAEITRPAGAEQAITEQERIDARQQRDEQADEDTINRAAVVGPGPPSMPETRRAIAQINMIRQTLAGEERELMTDEERATVTEARNQIIAAEARDAPVAAGYEDALDRADHILGKDADQQELIAAEERRVAQLPNQIQSLKRGHEIGRTRESTVREQRRALQAELHRHRRAGGEPITADLYHPPSGSLPDRLHKLFLRRGTEVIFFRPNGLYTGNASLYGIGSSLDRRVFININIADNSAMLMDIAIHEFIHTVQTSGEWNQFVEDMLELDPAGMDHASRAYYSRLHGLALAPDNTFGAREANYREWARSPVGDQEMVAMYFELHHREAGIYDRLASRKPRWLRRLIDYLDGLLASLHRDPYAVRNRERILAMRRLADAALTRDPLPEPKIRERLLAEDRATIKDAPRRLRSQINRLQSQIAIAQKQRQPGKVAQHKRMLALRVAELAQWEAANQPNYAVIHTPFGPTPSIVPNKYIRIELGKILHAIAEPVRSTPNSYRTPGQAERAVTEQGTEYRDLDLSAENLRPEDITGIDDATLEQLGQEAIDEVGRANFEHALRIHYGKHRRAKPAPKLRMLTAAQIQEIQKLPAKFRYWYETFTEELDARFPDMPDEVKQTLIAVTAVTSARTNVRENMSRALSIMTEAIANVPVTTDVISASAVREALMGVLGAADQMKVGSFDMTFQYLAGLSAEAPLTTNDTIMASIVGLKTDGFAQRPLYEWFSRYLIKITDRINANIEPGAEPLQPWQLQALLWSKKSATADTYSEAMRPFFDAFEEMGIVRRQGEHRYLLMEDLRANPDVVQKVRPAVPRYLRTVINTLETHTLNTENGKQAQELLRLILSTEDPDLVRAALTGPGKTTQKNSWHRIHQRLMERTLGKLKYRRPSQKTIKGTIATELAWAITGRFPHYTMAKEVARSSERTATISRVDLPRIDNETGDVIGAAGSWEGAANINALVPLWDMEPAERQLFMAVYGKAMNQSAMAAHRISPIESAEQASGVGIEAVFVPLYEGSQQAAQKAIRAMDAKRPGMSILMRNFPNGVLVYAVPDFETGNHVSALDLAEVADQAFGLSELAPEERPDVQAGFLDWQSEMTDYVEEGQYDAIIEGWIRETINAEAKKGSEWFERILRSPRKRSGVDAVLEVAPTYQQRRRLLQDGAAYLDGIEDLAPVIRERVLDALDRARSTSFLRAQEYLQEAAGDADAERGEWIDANTKRYERWAKSADRRPAEQVAAQPTVREPLANLSDQSLLAEYWFHEGAGNADLVGQVAPFAGEPDDIPYILGDPDQLGPIEPVQIAVLGQPDSGTISWGATLNALEGAAPMTDLHGPDVQEALDHTLAAAPDLADRQGELAEKVMEYLRERGIAGVVDPDNRRIAMFRPLTHDERVQFDDDAVQNRVVVGGPPIALRPNLLRRTDKEKKSLPQHRYFDIIDDRGKVIGELQGQLWSGDFRIGFIQVREPVSPGSPLTQNAINRLGVTGMRQIYRALRRELPDLKSIEGDKIMGKRGSLVTAETPTAIPIRREVPPINWAMAATPGDQMNLPFVPRPGDIHTEIAEVASTIARHVPEGKLSEPEVAEAVDLILTHLPKRLEVFKPKIRTNALTMIAKTRNAQGRIVKKQFEREHNRIIEQAAVRAQKAGGSVREKLRIAIHASDPNAARLSEDATLNALDRIEEISGRASARAARRVAQQETKQKLNDMRERARTDKNTVRGMLDNMVELVRNNLPRNVRDAMITQIRDVPFKSDPLLAFTQAIGRARAILDEYERRNTIRELITLLKSFKTEKLRPEFRDRVEELVGDLRLKAMTGPKRDQLEAMAAYIAADPEAANRFTQKQLKELDDLAKKPVRDLSRDEAQQLIDSVEALLHMNQTINKIFDDERLRNLDDLAASVSAEILRKWDERPVHEDGAIMHEGRFNIIDVAKLPFEATGVFKPTTYAEYLSGSTRTEMHRIFYEALDAGLTHWLRGYHSAMDALQEAMLDAGLPMDSDEVTAMSRELAGERGLWGAVLEGDVPTAERRRRSKATPVRDHRDGKIGIKLHNGKRLQMVAAERMHILALLRDPETYDLVVLGEAPIALKSGRKGEVFELNLDDLTAIEQSADPREIQIVDAMMQHIAGPIRDSFRKWSVKTHGYDMTRDGLWFTRSRQREKTLKPEEVTAQNFVQTQIQNQKMTKARTDDRVSAVLVGDFFVEYSNLAWASYAISEMSGAVNVAQSVLNRPEVKNALFNTKGSKSFAYWQRMLDELARQVVGGPRLSGPIGGATQSLINNVTKALLAANPRVMMYQVVSLSLAATEMPGVYIRGGMTDLFNLKLNDEMREHSPQLRARMEASALGIINEQAGMGGPRNFLGRRARGDTFMRGISMMDMVAIRGIWAAAKLQVKTDQPELSGQEYWDAVARTAERVVNNTQPVFDVLRASGIALEAKRNPLVKVLTMFMSQRNQNVNIMARKVMRMARGENPWDQVKGLGIVTFMQGLGIVAIKELWDWALDPFGDDDESEAKQWLAKMLDVIASNFYFGNYASYVGAKILTPDVHVFEPDMSPVTGLIDDLVAGSIKMGQGLTGTDDQFWRGAEQMAFATAAISGVPVAAPARMLLRFAKNLFDQDDKDRYDPDADRMRRRKVS